jgi:hypothetical protein
MECYFNKTHKVIMKYDANQNVRIIRVMPILTQVILEINTWLFRKVLWR